MVFPRSSFWRYPPLHFFISKPIDLSIGNLVNHMKHYGKWTSRSVSSAWLLLQISLKSQRGRSWWSKWRFLLPGFYQILLGNSENAPNVFFGSQYHFEAFFWWMVTYPDGVMINLDDFKVCLTIPVFSHISSLDSQHKRDQSQHLKSRKFYFRIAVPPVGVRDHYCVPYALRVG